MFYQALLLVALIHEGASFSTSDLTPCRRKKKNILLSVTYPRGEVKTSSSFPCTQINRRSRSRSFALYSTTEEAESATLTWQPIQKNFLLGQGVGEEADLIMRGCDAVVSTIKKNDNEINPDSVWVRTFHPQSTNKVIANLQIRDPKDESNSVPKEAMEAIQATHRWSSNFVRELHLCPWAGSSLDTPGAMRYWILVVDDDDNQSAVLDKMENVVREAGRHLEQITSPGISTGDGEGMDPIDPAVAISFVILVDKAEMSQSTSPTNRASNNLPDFGTFHEYFVDLEDRLLDECDEYWDGIDEEEANEEEVEENESNSPLGCQITIAAFHPQWQFDSAGGGNTNAGQPVDFEKRTPYPTISCVMSTAIDALMNGNANSDVTGRIGELNKKTLEGVGAERLGELFEDEVVKCPFSHDG